MRTIWKYPLELQARQAIQMPSGAQLLTCQLQDGFLTVWAIVETKNPAVQIEIAVVGTGNPMLFVERTYLGSAIHGNFVWHVFQL